MGRWGFLDHLRRLWVVHGFTVRFTWDFIETGYTKKAMLYKRPVDEKFPISAPYGAKGPWWSKHMNDRGAWCEGQVDGKGQHKGIDFAVPVGTPIVAVADGLIIRAGWENLSNPKQGFGQRVRHQIVNESGVVMTVVYGHMSVLHVHEGQQVVKGDRIGFSGATGHVTGPHLHIEIVDARGQYHPIDFEPLPQKPLENTPPSA